MAERAELLKCRERKNVNLPGVVVDLPTLTKKDEEDLVKWGVPNDIDLIAASFVRKKSDIEYIRKVGRLLSLPVEAAVELIPADGPHEHSLRHLCM